MMNPEEFPGDTPEDLWQLKLESEDGRFLKIFKDFAQLISRSEEVCQEVQNDPDFQFVAEAEGEYLEELIGASFIILQTKIRRVTRSALDLHKAMLTERQIDIHELSCTRRIHKLGGEYKSTSDSFIQLIWAVGNYYKHRDEWCVEVWEEKCAGEKDDNRLKLGRQTRRSVQRVGISQFSTGNMLTAYQFFDIYPYSKCEQLADKVQSWADQVYQTAVGSLKRSALAQGG
jgi:hypothetical protein